MPDKKVERLLELLRHAAVDDRVALSRVILAPCREADAWRPHFARIDVARPGDPPPVEPDDLGAARVLVERTSVAELADRFARFYDDGATGDFVLGGVAVVRPFDRSWSHYRVATQEAREWGVHWPFDQLSASIPDAPPNPIGGLDGSVYGPAKSLHAIFPRISGIRTYHGARDARLKTVQLYVWDYRARVVRCFVRSARFECQIEVDSRHKPRMAVFASPGDRPLPVGDVHDIVQVDAPDGTTSVHVQLTLDGEILDRWEAQPDDRGLPNGTPLPGARSCELLKQFLRPRSTPLPLSEPFLQRRLCEATREAISAFELHAVLHELERDGLVQKHMLDLQPQDIGLPGLPEPGESGWDATGIGLKAATLASFREDTPVPWSLGEERLVDQVVLAVGRGAQLPHQIDGACPLSATVDVERAVGVASETGLVEVEQPPFYSLTARGLAHRGQLEDHLREQAIAAVKPAGASSSPGEPTLEPLRLARAFMRDPKLQGIVDRDLGELVSALERGQHKTTLLLAGSLAEAMLLDVLDRNARLAKTHLKGKAWPDSASLAALVGIAQATSVRLKNGTQRALLSQTVAGMVNAITEHRDLIHPYAEVRQEIEVDATTAKSMVHLLEVVARDLQKASDAGALDAYERGDTV